MKKCKRLIENWKKHQTLTLFLMLVFLSVGISQTVCAASDTATGIDKELQIKGVVKEANGNPMIGVTVMVKETTALSCTVILIQI